MTNSSNESSCWETRPFVSKSVPPLKRQKQHAQAQAQAQAKQGPVSLLYPGNVVRRGDVLPTLYRMATERQALHRRRVWGSLAASPLTAPIGLVPLVPNIPFFYLIYRAWSHWRALNGSKHLQFLLEQQLLKPASLPALEQFYATNRAVVNGREHAEEGEKKQENGDDGQHTPTDDILLHHGDGKVLADILDAPELIAEVERAIYQIRVLHGEKDPKDTRSESDSESKNTRTEKGRTDTAPR
ncbi:hypothetical protein KEM52_003363 [Ascosphaera acerosa]|nr:hypothetical protein KEM52_003363 [Ascosphaera acerosa]